MYKIQFIVLPQEIIQSFPHDKKAKMVLLALSMDSTGK